MGSGSASPRSIAAANGAGISHIGGGADQIGKTEAPLGLVRAHAWPNTPHTPVFQFV